MNKYSRIRDFHKSRASAVGSSDIPILAGLTKRYGSTPYSLWEVKTGRKAPWSGNDKTWWGHVHENTILYRYVHDTFGPEEAAKFLVAKTRGRSMGAFKVLTECRHPDFRFAMAHADLVFDRGEMTRITEAKSHGLYAASRKEDPDFGYDSDDLSQNGLPASVFLQVQWQLLCYGISEADVAVLVNTNDYRLYGPVIADKKTHEGELALAQRFRWHVENDKPPQPTTWEDICSLFPEPRQTTAMISGEDEGKVRAMVAKKKTLLARQKKIKAELDDMKNAVGLLIGENAVLSSAEGDVFAKSSARSRESITASKIEKEMPETYRVLADAGMVKKSEWREVRF